VHDDGIAGRRAQRGEHRVRPLLAARHPDRALRGGHTGRECHHDLLDLLDRAQRVERPLEHRAAAHGYERLGPGRPKAHPPPGGHEERDRHAWMRG
jgi:hypothetical protein